MNFMTKSEIKSEVGKKWFLANQNTLNAKIIYISGLDRFDQYLGNSDQKDKSSVIHIKEMPKGLIVSLAKLFSTNKVGINYSKFKRIVLVKFERYSIIKFETVASPIFFGFANKDFAEIESFFASIIKIDFIEDSKLQIGSEIKIRFENYLYKNTYLLTVSTDDIKATKIKRLLNYIIDILVITVMSIPLIDKTDFSNYNFIIIIIFLFYYWIMEGLFSTTIGKIITNTKVVGTDGSCSDETFIRTISRIIPFEALSFLIGKNGWHDSISKTTVIDVDMRKKLLSKTYIKNSSNPY
ncbi:RDD family protein [Cellulophaga baltica]|uniref:RDD family protein n=1 Tax=Cellulophaga baltica TaxID=76594 RepID=UPI00040B839F|nr:RDD family protein [Cellulophaga baltica]